MFNKRAIFLDRDGTLIRIIHRPDFHKIITAPFKYEELVFVPDVHEALEMFKRAGFLRIMITNQPDVANGYMSQEEWQKIHDKVISTLDLDDFRMCQHASDSGCQCHKPSPWMLLSTARQKGIDLGKSFMIGDTSADMEAGRAAGCKTVLIDAFYNKDVQSDVRFKDLWMAALVISGGHKF